MIHEYPVTRYNKETGQWEDLDRTKLVMKHPGNEHYACGGQMFLLPQDRWLELNEPIGFGVHPHTEPVHIVYQCVVCGQIVKVTEQQFEEYFGFGEEDKFNRGVML